MGHRASFVESDEGWTGNCRIGFARRSAVLGVTPRFWVDMIELDPMQVELFKQPDQAITEHLKYADFEASIRGK